MTFDDMGDDDRHRDASRRHSLEKRGKRLPHFNDNGYHYPLLFALLLFSDMHFKHRRRHG